MHRKIPLLLAVAITFAGCSNQPASPSSAPAASDQPSEGAAAPAPSTTPTSAPEEPQPLQQPEVKEPKRYYVDTQNFFIHSVEESANEKIALLTFDDGPKGDSTLQILDILDRYHAKSIWFVSGFNYGYNYLPDPHKAKKFEEMILEIRKRGHIVANHSWSHENFKQLPPDVQRKEIASLSELLEKITGEKPKFIRPPFGSYTDVFQDEVKKQGMQWMNWSVGSLDWEYTDPQKVIQQTVSTMHNGANILMHDNPVEVQALDGILKRLTEQGYKFVLPTEVKPD
ncbi:polysaccharide deacetylase family protein [Effusibacillus consociatus]|uniref:Polysaccharide deacetylase family protein n=2 Tax=Effusibacillus consociatus TaxID=1117041 RepID=A0ABV9Q6Q6_9BACL